ncbi:serine/threonine-protein kinase [Azohydromonas caseinilytica]|uniref:Protein kinase n=1 Tax=Azohydromonas caseinilytica TaxID=2728836 RepID=A0A848F1R5_9BURK|nr:serine/threonine-protein kinase [Azohydromonas caseinilytica]NML13624.1 protein kinase [Azohydromonas caseinilytica]
MAIPERLGKYPITEVIGRGAMGIVYRGYDPVIKRPVAIKTIHKELIEDDDKAQSLSERFRREAQAAGTLSHPGIVSVYEYGEDGPWAYIAMEYVPGHSLREYLDRGPGFEERDVVSTMAQLLDALAYAHGHEIWHRDIKPANILVMPSGRIKLTDFGIARIESADRTRTNIIMGTPGYIAPEFYLGGVLDHRIDIFSCGVLLYHLLARQPPFRGRIEAVMHDVCYHDPAPPSTVDPGHRWPQYDAVVARALAKAPAERFQSAAAFRAAILAQYGRPLADTLSEATVISAPPLRPLGAEAGAPPVPAPASALSHSPPSTPPPTGWSPPVLKSVETELARFVGPVARVLVRRAAQQHKQLGSLASALTETIDQPRDREAFLRAVLGRSAMLTAATVGGTDSGTPTPVHTTSPALTAADIEQATRLLTTYIGPIARVVAKRAAAHGGGRREFLDELGRSLDDEAQRQRFLREAGASGG